MATKSSDVKKVLALREMDTILRKGYAESLERMTQYTTVQCGACKCNFLLYCTSGAPSIEHGIISDAHGEVEGYQFRFPCPDCGVLLRVDEDEIELRAWAKPDSQHS